MAQFFGSTPAAAQSNYTLSEILNYALRRAIIVIERSRSGTSFPASGGFRKESYTLGGRVKMSERRAPAWVRASFDRFLDQAKYASELLHLSLQGIRVLTRMPNVVETLRRIAPDEDREEDLTRAKHEAELASRESDDGFPLLHSHAIVTLWSYLEALIQSFVTQWIANVPATLQRAPFAKLKVSLSEYEGLNSDTRPEYLFELLKKDIASGLRAGVDQFEALLDAIGLSGPVPADVKQDLFELGQLRNCILHRGGVADRRLETNCPWLGIASGTPLVVTHAQYERLQEATHRYVVLLIVRLGEHYGVDMTQERDSAKLPPRAPSAG